MALDEMIASPPRRSAAAASSTIASPSAPRKRTKKVTKQVEIVDARGYFIVQEVEEEVRVGWGACSVSGTDKR